MGPGFYRHKYDHRKGLRVDESTPQRGWFSLVVVTGAGLVSGAMGWRVVDEINAMGVFSDLYEPMETPR